MPSSWTHMRVRKGAFRKSARQLRRLFPASGHRSKRFVAAAARARKQASFTSRAEALRSVRQELRGQQLLKFAPQAMATHILTVMAAAGLALGATAQACHTAPLTICLYLLACRSRTDLTLMLACACGELDLGVLLGQCYSGLCALQSFRSTGLCQKLASVLAVQTANALQA